MAWFHRTLAEWTKRNRTRRRRGHQLPVQEIRTVETLEARRMLVGEDAAFHLSFTNSAGQEITSVPLGETFLLKVEVEDLREPSGNEGRGVSQAIVDVLYDNALVSLTDGVIQHGDDFGRFADLLGRNDLSIPGLLNEVGSAIPQFTNPEFSLGLGRFELFSVEFRADAVGTVEFATNFADLPSSDILLHGGGQRENEDEVVLPTTSLMIVQAGDLVAGVDLTVSLTPTATDANGQVNQLPADEVWIDEWDSYWAEIWVTSAGFSGQAVEAASVNLAYDTTIFTATEVQAGPAFALDQATQIDDSTGQVTVNATLQAGVQVGDTEHVLLGRVRLESTESDTGVPIDLEQAALITPVETGWISLPEGLNTSVTVAGQSASTNVTLGAAPETELWPVMFDLDDSGRVGFGDLAIFAATFLDTVSPTNPISLKTDFDLSGRVGFGDLAVFAANFLDNQTAGNRRVYTSLFPDAFRPLPQLLLSSTQSTNGTMAVADEITIRKDEGNLLIRVLDNDVLGEDGQGLSLQSVDTTGTVGTVIEAGNSVIYNPFGRFDHLAAGESAIDTFQYTVTDVLGNTSQATVTITIEGADPLALLDIVAVDTPTTTDALGHVASLPAGDAWISEWEPFWAEVWLQTSPETTGEITRATASVLYNTDLFTAVAVEPGPGTTFESNDDFDVEPPLLNDQDGRVQIDARNVAAGLGENHQAALIARIRFEPTEADSGVDLRLQESPPLVPVSDDWLRITSGTAAIGTPDPTTPPEPTDLIDIGPGASTNVWPVPYDLDDSQRVGFTDLAFFAASFLQPTTDSPSAQAADFDSSGRVDFADLSLLAANFLQTSTSGQPVVLANNFPESFVPQVAQLQASGNLSQISNELTASDLVAVAAEARHRLGAVYGEEAEARLESVVMFPADLVEGRLGQTNGNIIQIDKDAAGAGWFVDATPWDDLEFSEANDHGVSFALPDGDAAGRVDLLSLVMHEYGHVLGLEHSPDETSLMHETLTVGQRRSPDGDADHTAADHYFQTLSDS